MMNSISNFAVTLDKSMDYLPVVSSITNVVDLVAKAALYLLSKTFSGAYGKMRHSPYVKHISEKSVKDCLILALPLVNIFYVRSCHCRGEVYNNSGENVEDINKVTPSVNCCKEEEDVSQNKETSCCKPSTVTL